jgi:hypothetical protein
MAKKLIKRIPAGPRLTAAVAEKVFGWKKVHNRDGELVGKKKDQAGRWQKARVPD